ncbi:MAG: phosphatase PAP2 family protein [Solirubrobacteraceae bacterium]|jgi:membrane-associated phospholipid phosphatase
MSEHAYTARAMPPRPVVRRAQPAGAAGALGLAGLCVLALALVWAVAELVPAVQIKDAVALHDFTLLSRPRIDGPALFLLHLLNPLQFVLWGTALVAIAFARERPRVALAVAAVMGLAPFTAEMLKPLLAHPHVQIGLVHIGPASWPSGHSTAALALVLSAVLVAPSRLRPLVASVGAVFAVAVGAALLILAWHMPSDVLGGYLVATLWAALAVAALRAADRRWPPRVRS